MKSPSILPVLFCTALVSFVSIQDVQANPRIPINLEGRLVALEDKIKHLGSKPASASSLSGIQVELSQMQEELRAIRGGIEENRYAIDQLQRELKLAGEESEYRLQALEKKAGLSAFSDEEGAPVDPFGDAEAVTPDVAPTPPPVVNTPPVQPPFSAPVPIAEPAPPPVLAPQPPVNTMAPVANGLNFSEPREHYNYAVSLVKQKNYDRARDSFARFVTMHPKHGLTGNAYYWLGETYYVKSEFVTAADTFRQGFEASPNGIKAPDNLYKLAKSLLHLNKKEEACIVLGQIQKRYSDRNPEVAGLAFETEKANNCR